MAAENLGPSEPWQIRSFPAGLRQRLVDEAHARRESVGNLLTRIVVTYLDGSNNASHAADASNSAFDVVQLAPLVGAMPRWLRAALWRRVAREMGVEAPANVRKPRLSDGTSLTPCGWEPTPETHQEANPPSDEPK